MLELKNICKRYGKKEVLHDISINLSSGIYGLIGPNGAGKTTLMNIMADVIKPTSGSISFEGEDIKKIGDDYRGRLGFLPQKIGYYDNFTAHEMLVYFANLKGIDISKKEILEKEISNMLEMVNLSNVANQKVSTFSGGMKQRLGIAIVMLGNPDILILDEPTVGLDPMERIQFRNTLSNISEEKIILLSTHIVSDIENIAQNIIMMNQGKIILNDSYENAMDIVNNKMWTAKVDDEMFSVFSQKYNVVNIGRRLNGERYIDFFSDAVPEYAGCHEKNVDLQDLYVHVYGKKN